MLVSTVYVYAGCIYFISKYNHISSVSAFYINLAHVYFACMLHVLCLCVATFDHQFWGGCACMCVEHFIVPSQDAMERYLPSDLDLKGGLF